MRLVPAFALALSPTLVGGAVVAFGACGGSAFSAGATDDAGPVDAPVVTGPKESFCELEAGTHTFCDDFDDEYDGSTLTSLWPTYDRSTGAAAQDDTSIFVSSPSSFESACPASLGGLLHARIGRQFPGTSTTRVLVAFDLHLDKVGAKPNVSGGTTFVLLTLGANYSIGLTANQDQISAFENLTLADGGADNATEIVALTPPVLGNWAHVVFDIDLAAGKVGANVAGTAFGPMAITPPTGIAPTVFIGLSSREVSTAVEAHFDNVTIDVTP